MSDTWYRVKVKLYRMPLVRKVLLPFTSLPQGERWVFIVGCYNSGTTLLWRMLTAHPATATLPAEGVAFTEQLARPEDFGWTRMWHCCMDKIALDETSRGIDADRVKREWAIWLDPAKKVYVEKSIANSARLRWLQRHFDNPYVLAIVRNGYAVAEGIRRRALQGKLPRHYSMDMCARQWVVNNHVITTDSSYLTHFLVLKYEDLVSKPKKMLNDIYNFLGIEPIQIDMTSQGIILNQQEFRLANMNESSIKRLKKSDIDAINKVASETLRTYGYDVLQTI